MQQTPLLLRIAIAEQDCVHQQGLLERLLQYVVSSSVLVNRRKMIAIFNLSSFFKFKATVKPFRIFYRTNDNELASELGNLGFCLDFVEQTA